MRASTAAVLSLATPTPAPPPGEGIASFRAFASSHSASISASVASCGAFPSRQARVRSRRSGARISGWSRRSTASGSARRWRARLTAANRRSPTSAAASVAVADRARLRSRRLPRGFCAAPRADRSSRSRPCSALSCSFSARVRAGRATGTPASAPSLLAPPCAAFARLLLRLDPFPQALDGLRGLRALIAEHMRMPANELRGDAPRPRRRNRTRPVPRPCGRERRPGAGDRPVPP